jgi:hypothetical protein
MVQLLPARVKRKQTANRWDEPNERHLGDALSRRDGGIAKDNY